MRGWGPIKYGKATSSNGSPQTRLRLGVSQILQGLEIYSMRQSL